MINKFYSIYLNRRCFRSCPYCDVVKPKLDKKKLSVNDWKKVFHILEKSVGIDFFLVLGTEPFLLGDDLVKLVRFWSKKDYRYALYSTADKKLFNKLSSRLVLAGLRNFSCGLDFINEVYGQCKSKVDKRTRKLVDESYYTLLSKSVDSLSNIRYMLDANIEEVLALITISRMNIEFVPEMIVYLVDNFSERLKISCNFVEYSSSSVMDFAKSVSDDLYYGFRNDKSDNEVFAKFLRKIDNLPDRYYRRLQPPLMYLMDYRYVVEQTRKCCIHTCAMGIECNGKLRACGYNYGKRVSRWSVFDIPKHKQKIFDDWKRDIDECAGCYWAWPYMIEYCGKDIAIFDSELWKRKLVGRL